MSLAARDNAMVAVENRRQRRQYKCWHCSKVFKRSEHCVRHERIHTQEKPFACRFCQKSYSRKDLVTRHERTLHAASQPDHEACAHNQSNAHTSPGLSSSQGSRRDRSNTDQQTDFAVEAPPACKDDANNMNRQIGSDPSSVPTANESLPATVLSSQDTHQNSEIVSTRDQHSVFFPGGDISSQSFPPLTGLDDSFVALDERTIFPIDVDMDWPLHRSQQNGVSDEQDRSQQHSSTGFSPPDTIRQFNQTGQALATAPYQRQTGMPNFLVSPISDQLWDINNYDFIAHVKGHGHREAANVNLDIFGDSRNGSSAAAVFDTNGDSLSTTSTNPVATATGESQKPLPFLLIEENKPSNVTLVLDKSIHDSLCQDLGERLNIEDASQDIPPARLCQFFLSGYADFFQCNLPVIHLPSLCLRTTPSPLVLAMCCIGALYRLDRKRAKGLYKVARRALQREVECKHSVRETEQTQVLASSQDISSLLDIPPLWAVQSTLLLTFFAAMSDDTTLVSHAMKDTGFYILAYSKAKAFLKEHNGDTSLTWANWIQRESWKRTLGGIYIVTTLMMAVYDINPIFNATSDLELESFHDDRLWNAKSSLEWQELQTSDLIHTHTTIRSIFTDVISTDGHEHERKFYHISPFSALIVMHAMTTHMWQRLQLLNSFRSFPSTSKRSQEDLEASWFLNNGLRSLSKCQNILKRSRQKYSQDSENLSESPLMYSCQAILRIAYMRLFDAAGAFNRLCLVDMDPAAIDASASVFASLQLKRSPQMLNIVRQAFGGLKVPIQMGHMFVRKTGAFRWGVEHAVTAWDSALFITKWIHSVEIDENNNKEPHPEEQELLAYMKDLFEEADYDSKGSKSFAAGMARTWALFLHDVWVWGVTPHMGVVLERLAMAYERMNEANRAS